MEYEVRARGAGVIITVVIEALNEDDAKRQVAAQSLMALSIKQRSRAWGFAQGEQRTSFALILFSQELLALLEAGLTVVEALDALIEKERRPDVRNILSRLLQGLHEGKSFSGTLQGMPRIFPPLYVSIVRAAERTSDLHAALGRYVDYQVRLDAIKSKVLSASIYPAILLIVGTLVAVFLLGYVVPRFSSVYQGTGRQLPKLSSLLIAWGNLVSQHQEIFLLGTLAAAAVIVIAVQYAWRRGGILRELQRIPFVANMVQTFQFARLYLTLGMLLDGGLPIVQGLGLVGEVLSPHLRARVQAASQAIQRGESISQALDRHALTTSVGLRLLRVGEQSGRMGDMMGRTAKIYDSEIGRSIEWFSRVFEPLLMAVIGIVIGGIVVLLYMPIFDLAGSIE